MPVWHSKSVKPSSIQSIPKVLLLQADDKKDSLANKQGFLFIFFNKKTCSAEQIVCIIKIKGVPLYRLLR